MSDELEPQGMKRREFIRKAAVTGATVAWAAPVVRTLAGAPAFAQTATPQDGGKDFSYIALCLRCDDGGVVTHCRIKIDLDENGNGPAECDTGDRFPTPGCSLTCSATSNCRPGICDQILATSSDGGKTVTVHLPAGCTVHEGKAVGKCGNPPDNGDCVTTFATGPGTVTFSMCDV